MYIPLSTGGGRAAHLPRQATGQPASGVARTRRRKNNGDLSPGFPIESNHSNRINRSNRINQIESIESIESNQLNRLDSIGSIESNQSNRSNHSNLSNRSDQIESNHSNHQVSTNDPASGGGEGDAASSASQGNSEKK